MSLPIRDFLLLTYGAFDGKICGKTKLQKLVYFLSVCLGKDLEYGPHYYGPYSSAVSQANSELKSLGYLAESTVSYGSYNPQGFEVARHDFFLTDDGKELLAIKKERHVREWDRISKAAEMIKSAGDLSYIELSVAAKTYYVLNRQASSKTVPNIKNMAAKLGWSITHQQIHSATDFLRQMNLLD